MPNYEISGEVTLTTEISPEGELVNDEIPNLTEDTYWSAETVTFQAEVNFQLEAPSEEMAEQLAQTLLEALEYRGDSIDWEVSDPTVTNVERLDEPMTLERAIEILKQYLATPTSAQLVPSPELNEAISFVLSYLLERTTVSAIPGPHGIIAGTRQ